ncbi:Single-strand DNA-binding [Candidatus Magnetomorum sp. HK-1]|nr:Single-strand DNA-binding [Candidatus Magnetomorum sp. HK-1]
MFNKVFLIGNLTKDPDVRYTPSGIAVTKFTIAINRSFKKKDDDTANEADFIRIATWRRLAEICGEFLKKGSAVFIEGRLQISSYEKDGEQKTIAEIVADNMQILSKRQDNKQS